jgi:hypothetical protein
LVLAYLRSHCPGAASYLVSKNPSRTYNTRKTCRSSCTFAAAVEPNSSGNIAKLVLTRAKRPLRSGWAAVVTAPLAKRVLTVPFLVALRTDVYSTSGAQGKAKPNFLNRGQPGASLRPGFATKSSRRKLLRWTASHQNTLHLVANRALVSNQQPKRILGRLIVVSRRRP